MSEFDELVVVVLSTLNSRRIGVFDDIGCLSTAAKQVKDAEQASIVRVLAPICADKFQHSADAGTNLEALKKTDSWNRDVLIEKAGWATFPGSEPDRKVAQACANLLSQTK